MNTEFLLCWDTHMSTHSHSLVSEYSGPQLLINGIVPDAATEVVIQCRNCVAMAENFTMFLFEHNGLSSYPRNHSSSDSSDEAKCENLYLILADIEDRRPVLKYPFTITADVSQGCRGQSITLLFILCKSCNINIASLHANHATLIWLDCHFISIEKWTALSDRLSSFPMTSNISI